MIHNKHVTILGAGLVGSLLATLLQKRGFEVTIYERRGDMRLQKVEAGRSINLAMSVRGWTALELAGLKEDIQAIAIPMYSRGIHNVGSEIVLQPYGKNNEAIYSVSRGELNKKLMSLAEHHGAKIQFDQRITDVDVNTNTLTIQDANSSKHNKVQIDGLLIAADGAFSPLRTAYTKLDRYNYSQHYIEHGYKELCIPAGANQSFQIEKNALHIWPRKNYMLIALPNIDGSFTCTLFLPFHGNPSFDSLKTVEDVNSFFKQQFPNAFEMMPTLTEDFFSNPTSSLITVKCEPWIYKNKSMLIGDAAHAIVPFYGQGMNAGFEDCRVFIETLEANASDTDWDNTLLQYQKARKKNGDAVAALAMQNFIEMRDLVAEPTFLERKKIEKELGKLYPSQFNSVYEMVSFSNTEYAYAIACQKAQDSLLAHIQTEGNWDLLKDDANFKTKLDAWMQEYADNVRAIVI